MSTDRHETSPYAGDLSPREAWQALVADSGAVLIDVRTRAEWSYVGVPDLSSLGRAAAFIEWQSFPDGGLNAGFADQVGEIGILPEQAILLICRSGVRSAHAAAALTALGFGTCFNVAEGFEGDIDQSGHRGNLGGWKHANLPWRQG